MKNSISGQLNQILNYLVKWQHPLPGYLNEGLAHQELSDQFVSIGLVPTEELIELYSWRNGTKIIEGTPLDNIQIFPGFHFLSLEDASVSYEAMKLDTRWNTHWFPVFANGGGDFYAIDLSLADKNSAPLVGFILGEIEQEFEYQNLKTMLATLLECFEKDIIFRTDDGFLEMDDIEQAEIARKHNPDIEFWRS